MKPEVSLPYSQEPNACSYPEPQPFPKWYLVDFSPQPWYVHANNSPIRWRVLITKALIMLRFLHPSVTCCVASASCSHTPVFWKFFLPIGTSKIIFTPMKMFTGRKKLLVRSASVYQMTAELLARHFIWKGQKYASLYRKQKLNNYFRLFILHYPIILYIKTLKLGYICSIAKCWTGYLEFFAVLQKFLCTYSTTSPGKPLCVHSLTIWRLTATLVVVPHR